jgi:hypothetical protein
MGFNSGLKEFNVVPGENAIPAKFHYEPDNANDTIAQSFLSEFIQTGNTLPLSIHGDSLSSPYPSLVPALEGISLSTSLNGTSNCPLSIPHTQRTPYFKALTPHQLSHILTYISH